MSDTKTKTKFGFALACALLTTTAFAETKEPTDLSFTDLVATWCDPCRKVTERLKKFETKYYDEVEIVVISYDSSTALSKYMSDKKTWYSISSDFYTKDEKMKLNKWANGNTVPTIPSHIIFDSTGNYVMNRKFGKKFPLSN